MLEGSDIAIGLHPAGDFFLCKPIIDAKIGEMQSQEVFKHKVSERVCT